MFVFLLELELLFGLDVKGLIEAGILIFKKLALVVELLGVFLYDLDFLFVLLLDIERHFFDLFDFGEVFRVDTLLEGVVFELVLGFLFF